MADTNSDDLDQLLDSALDDFSTLDLSSSRRSDGNGSGAAGAPSSSSPSLGKGLGLGLGSGLPELGAGKRKGKQKAVAATGPKESHASAALEELRRQTREEVKGLESATAGTAPSRGGFGFENEGMEDFVKQFEKLAGSQVTYSQRLQNKWTTRNTVYYLSYDLPTQSSKSKERTKEEKLRLKKLSTYGLL